MSDKVIQLHAGLRKPRGAARGVPPVSQAPRLRDGVGSDAGRSFLAAGGSSGRALELQLVRIAHLIAELSDLLEASRGETAELHLHPAAARRLSHVGELLAAAEFAGEEAGDDEVDPQPEVDKERLDRMYQTIGPDA